LVRAGEVDAFYNVDFSRVRPIRPKEPEGGPDTTDTARHVGDVGDKEAMRVGFVGGDTDGSAARGGIDGARVDAHVDLVIVCVD